MAIDMFLKLGDIKGESRDQAHRDEIDITRWGWSLSQSGSMHSGTGGGPIRFGWNIRENIKL